MLIGAALVAAYFWATPAHLWQAPPLLKPAPQGRMPASDHWRMTFASDADTTMVHAASMVELPDGRLRAFWFAGSREGASDVAIHSALFDPRNGSWADEHVAVTREQIADQWGRYVRKLGNAVPVLDDNGHMRLFVVAVSFGGWAASRLVVLGSDDLGTSWQFEDALTTSPFMNISTLVKAPPIRYSDGTVGLPVYHEMLGKFGEILRLDPQNHILGKARIGHGRKAIQPLVLVDSPTHAAAFLRNEQRPNNGHLYQSHSVNGGWDWQPLTYSRLTNPSSALGGVVIAPGHWLLATNCNTEERDDLCIRETRDGGASWTPRWFFHNRQAWRDDQMQPRPFLNMIDNELDKTVQVDNPARYLDRVRENKCRRGECTFQYDYPYMLRASNGDLHVLYTWNKAAIRHAWLRADGGGA
ncbi:hypothetical protein A11A3_02647 [Alcanivorax hongdengensis A-11-3]|uniref:Sialidase domain-containing protein n=1 Tax=Alcanivorax hongdengensis A-11-3 TaxID=1177179 RepID=L0WHU4_9GAMM|nr:hypothetical protein A11A3_02647 [Alcanivorax hongdengensis A-11-3]